RHAAGDDRAVRRGCIVRPGRAPARRRRAAARARPARGAECRALDGGSHDPVARCLARGAHPAPPPRVPRAARARDPTVRRPRAFADRLRRQRQLDDRARRAGDDGLADLSIHTPRVMRAPPLYDRCSPREADLEAAVDPPRMTTWHAWVEVAALAA